MISDTRGAPVIHGQAERAGPALLGKEETEGTPYQCV